MWSIVYSTWVEYPGSCTIDRKISFYLCIRFRCLPLIASLHTQSSAPIFSQCCGKCRLVVGQTETTLAFPTSKRFNRFCRAAAVVVLPAGSTAWWIAQLPFVLETGRDRNGWRWARFTCEPQSGLALIIGLDTKLKCFVTSVYASLERSKIRQRHGSGTALHQLHGTIKKTEVNSYTTTSPELPLIPQKYANSCSFLFFFNQRLTRCTFYPF